MMPAAGWVGGHLLVAGGMAMSGMMPVMVPETVVYSETTWPQQATATLDVRHEANRHTLLVQHDIRYASEGLLAVQHEIVPAGDATATLRVQHQVLAPRAARLTVQHEVALPDGAAIDVGSGAPLPSDGPVTIGTLREQVGSGPMADLQRFDEVWPAAGRVEFQQVLVRPGVDPVVLTVARDVAPAPYGRSYSTSGGMPILELSTPNPAEALAAVVLPELVERLVVSEDGGTTTTTDPPSAELTDLNALLGARGDVECDDEDAAGSGSLPTQTRRDVAEAAAAHAGFGLVLLGNIPNLDATVSEGYTTSGKTAAAVINELLLPSRPRTYYTLDTMTIDARAYSGLSADGDDLLDPELQAHDGISWSDNPPADEPEPQLSDYTDRCERYNPDADPVGDGQTDVPGTFETWDDGTFEWTERAGVGDDYRETRRALAKIAGRVTQEVEEVRSRYRQSYDSQLRQWGITSQRTIRNSYHPACREALTRREETTSQRRSVEDIPNVANTIGVDDTTPTAVEDEQRLIFEALPTWYDTETLLVEQSWHAEGWLRSREETRRRLSGMIATPQMDGSGELTGYEIQLTYDTTTRSETYLPVGNGLWHIATTIRELAQQPVFEPVNPDAAPGDDDYGVTELTRVTKVPIVHSYTEVTDRAPPSVSCSDPCADADPYSACLAEAQRAYDQDHADWAARMQNEGARRVWTIEANQLLPGLFIGQERGQGVVTSVRHERTPSEARTIFEVTEWHP